MRCGDLRRHRRPGHQEADACDLRPGQPRAAARQRSRWSGSPDGIGPTRISASSSATPSEQHARTPYRQEVWDRLAEGIRFVQGTFDDEKAFERLAETAGEARRRAGHRRQPRVLSVDSAQGLPAGVRAAAEVRVGPAAGGPLEPGGHREAVRPRPAERPRAQRRGQQRLPRGVGVPHRPLPRQGDRPEHPGAAVRQRAVRADLEQQLRRQRADHHGRGHRPRRPGRLLRRGRRGPRCDPEPPDCS